MNDNGFLVLPENCGTYLVAEGEPPNVCCICGTPGHLHRPEESADVLTGMGIVGVIGAGHATRVTVSGGFDLDWAD